MRLMDVRFIDRDVRFMNVQSIWLEYKNDKI